MLPLSAAAVAGARVLAAAAAERQRQRCRQRPAVTTTDLEQVIALMDAHDSKTVAMLLIAYGYAKEPTEPKVDEPDDTNLEQTEGEGDQ